MFLLFVKVLYRVEGFVDKNNDLLYRDLSQAMYKANHSLIKQLFPEGNPTKVNLKRPPTAGFQFRASVGTLMRNLQTKNPNYIRYVLLFILSILVIVLVHDIGWISKTITILFSILALTNELLVIQPTYLIAHT